MVLFKANSASDINLYQYVPLVGSVSFANIGPKMRFTFPTCPLALGDAVATSTRTISSYAIF